MTSAALFAVSVAMPEPWRYVLWAIGIAWSRAPCSARRAPPPANADEALDPHHFAERFGLFLIILLGEVVVEAGQASVDGT